MLKTLILSIMIDLLHPRVQQRSYIREPLVDAQLRYESIAEDISAVAMDENEPPLFKGPAAREATAVLLSAVAWHESGFRKDVDICKGIRSKGDNGLSVGLLQVMKGRNYEGHSAREICEDRKLAIRLGLHVLRRAKETCHGGPRAWLQSYAAGGCGVNSTSSRDACAAFERVGQKHLLGISCASAGPVSRRPTPEAPRIERFDPLKQLQVELPPAPPKPSNSMIPAWLREAAEPGR
jgi:Transglycosylase SLT domain